MTRLVATRGCEVMRRRFKSHLRIPCPIPTLTHDALYAVPYVETVTRPYVVQWCKSTPMSWGGAALSTAASDRPDPCVSSPPLCVVRTYGRRLACGHTVDARRDSQCGHPGHPVMPLRCCGQLPRTPAPTGPDLYVGEIPRPGKPPGPPFPGPLMSVSRSVNDFPLGLRRKYADSFANLTWLSHWGLFEDHPATGWTASHRPGKVGRMRGDEPGPPYAGGRTRASVRGPLVLVLALVKGGLGPLRGKDRLLRLGLQGRCDQAHVKWQGGFVSSTPRKKGVGRVARHFPGMEGQSPGGGKVGSRHGVASAAPWRLWRTSRPPHTSGGSAGSRMLPESRRG